MLEKLKNFKKSESGQSVVLIAILLTVLLGFGALAVDVGYMTHQKSRMQNAADAAALAGAMLMPTYDLTKTDDKNVLDTKTIEYAKENFQFEGANFTVTPDTTTQTLEVMITQNVPKFLSGIFTDSDKAMIVKAKAKYGYKWFGEALPFVNLDDACSAKGDIIDLWEKTNITGNFESIWKEDFEYIKAFNIFKINYTDGAITIAEGRKMDKSDDVESVVKPSYLNNLPVYFFSLSNDYIGTYTKDNLKNKTEIPLTQMVLVKAYVNYFDFTNANEPVMKLRVEEIYDINSGVVPTDYNNSFAKTTSQLIN